LLPGIKLRGIIARTEVANEETFVILYLSLFNDVQLMTDKNFS
jgi:hypothetical protein